MAPTIETKDSVDSGKTNVLSSSTEHGQKAIEGLTEEQRQLFIELARSEGKHGVQGGAIHDSHLAEMMQSNTPIAPVALGIWMGDIKVNGWERRVAASDIREQLPEIIVQHPHLREMGIDRFYNRYCYTLSHCRGEKDNVPLAYWSHHMMNKAPELKGEMIERLKGFESKTYLGKALEDERFSPDAAKALLDLKGEPEDLPREFNLCQAIIGKFPDSDDATRAQQRIDALFEAALAKKLQFGMSFLEDLIYNRPEYRERAFELALNGYSHDQHQREGLYAKLITNPPTPEIKLRVADHLLTRDAENIHNYWGYMGSCQFVFAHVPERRTQALAILKEKAQRKHLADSMRAVPEHSDEIMDTIEGKDEKAIAHNKAKDAEKDGSYKWYPVLSSTDIKPYFDSMVGAMNETQTPAIADRLGRYINDKAENNYMVRYDKEAWRYADVIVHPNVSSETRQAAWQKMASAEFHYLQYRVPAFLKVVEAELEGYSVEAARAVLDELSIHGLKTVVEHVGTLSPELQAEAGRRILAQKSVSNTDMEFVRQHIPSLTNETVAHGRPAYEDVIAKVRAALVKV